MAANEFGDFSPRPEDKIEEELLPQPLPPEDGDETSASLVKEMIIEEEMEELASGSQDDTQILKGRDSHCDTPDADIQRDSGGDEGFVFQDIVEEDLAAQQLGDVGTPNRGTGVLSGLCTGEGGIAGEVPFIKTDRRELDDIRMLSTGFGSVRAEDEECVEDVSKAKEMGRQTGEKSVDEVSVFSGITGDCGTPAGDGEGGDDAGLISLVEETSCGGEETAGDGGFLLLADDKEDGGQDTSLILPQDTPSPFHASLCSDNVTAGALELNSVTMETSPLTAGAGQLTGVQESYETLGEEDKSLLENIPEPRVRKRGRPSRELGALLMDCIVGRLGTRELESQGTSTLAPEREAADTKVVSERIAMNEVRVTRSQASGRSATKDANVDPKVQTISPPDIPAKRTGKRSVTRGGRPGWGNANESCSQSLELVADAGEKMSKLSEDMGEDVRDAHTDSELVKSTRKSRGKGKTVSSVVGCATSELKPEEKADPGEMLTSPVTRGPENVEASELVLNYFNGMNASNRAESVPQGALCTQNSEEVKPLYVDSILEVTNVGRRRSNRQTAKTVKKEEECGYSQSGKDSEGRKRSPEGGGNKVLEVLDNHVNQQANNAEHGTENFPVHGNVTSKCGDSETDIGTQKFPPRRSTGRKLARENRKTVAANLVKQEKEVAVSGCTVGEEKSEERSGVKENGTDLASVKSFNRESEYEEDMERAEEDGGCLEEIVSAGDNCVSADQGSDRNTSSIKGDIIGDACQDQETLQNSPRTITAVRNVETSDLPRNKVDSTESAERLENKETCNSSAYVDPVAAFSEANDTNLVGSSSSVKLGSEISEQKDAIKGGTGVSSEEADDRLKTSSDGGNVKTAEGDAARNNLDDTGYATSCDSLVNKEGEVAKIDEGVNPTLGLAGIGGSGDLILSAETAERTSPPGTKGKGQTRARQRKGTQQQTGAKLGTQTSKKGRKPSRKNGSASCDETCVPLEESARTKSKKKQVTGRRDRRKSVAETNKMDGGRDEANEEQIGPAAEDKAACSGSEVEIAERRNNGVSGDVGPSRQSSVPLELVSDKCETSSEARPVGRAKSSRKPKGGEKKPKKAPVPDAEAIPSVAKRKNEARRPSKTKGATIKALLREKIKQVVSGVQGGTGDAQAGGRVRKDVDAAHSLDGAQISLNVECLEGSRVREGTDSPDDTAAAGEDMSSGVTQGDGSEDVERRADGVVSEDDVPRKSWVLCDDCKKWRCIPVELADEIDDTNAKWSCRDNPNPDFADCSIPQEKSNAEINAELQISEVSASEAEDDNDGIESKLTEVGARSGENKPAVWKMIRRNIFRHRRAKTQASDEVMICQCTPPDDGGVGCGDNCLNRVLNIECVQEYCPCGEACSNQQFQKRMYAPVATFRCGKKGFGLKVLKRIPKDSFLIEYVGEVLDVNAFEKRQEEYARIGQKHFYFMTLNSNEVIDACSKGNLGRFINHSCEPNCKTEKWMVNGEVCIGLFAIRDIGENEEVTFDYNYVRVRGASAKKCECGSSQCRGFIGTDSETPRDEIVESDSDDEEDPEPIMVVNSDEEDHHVREDKVPPLRKQNDDMVYQEPIRPSRIKRKLVIPKEKVPPSAKRMKTTVSSYIKKLGSSHSKGLTVDIGGGRHEGGRALTSDVQEKLDDLLDDTGGLRRKKDVPRQYLKLLVLSGASGDNEKDASACSVRDISLLLEALLRTWSRIVLSEIMKSNGLRILQRFIVQLRTQWDKTPILRKLMKVLEHLSSDRVSVLTQNMINSAAPSRRVESFSESLFELTRHRDPEVCNMARRFRYKWIPPRPPVYEHYNKGADRPPQPPPKSVSPVKMSNETPLDDNQFSSSRKQSPNIACLEGTEASKIVTALLSVSGTAARLSLGETPLPGASVPQTATAGNGKRKRVSRWDAPAKVRKGTYEPAAGGSSADLPGVNSTPPSRQTAVPLVSAGHSAGAQSLSQGSREPLSKRQRQFGSNCQNGSASSPFRSEASVTCSSGKQGAEELSGASSNLPGKLPPHKGRQTDLPGQSAGWPPATSTVNQDPPRLPFGPTSGQPQIHSGPIPVLPQGRPESVYVMTAQPHLPQVHGAFTIPAAIPPSGPPVQVPAGVIPQNPGPHQVLAANGVTPGGVGFPANVYPGCPPLHMCPGGPSLQGVHGMAPNMSYAYPQGIPYGHWGTGVGTPHFVGPPAFSFDESRRYLPQPMWQNTSSCGEHVPGVKMEQGTSIGKGLPSNALQTTSNLEAEPPVPGLSPPPSTTSNTQDSGGATNPCSRDSTQEKAIPAESRDSGRHDGNCEVPEKRRDREHRTDHHRGGISDVRETGSGFHEEHFGDPESPSFRNNVCSLVRSCLRKHKLRTREVDKLCPKMVEVIVRKEVANCAETRNRGCERSKYIVRSKLVHKVETYVEREVEKSRKYDRNHKSGASAR